MIEQSKNGIIVIVLISTLFGLVAGLVGSLTVRSYFGTSSAFWGELNFVNGNLDRPNVVISGAKKVVVAQDEKISETIGHVGSNLVGIYLEKATSTKKDGVDLKSFYKNSDALGAGLIVTSDGWIVTDAFSPLDFTEKNKAINMKKYVVIKDNNDIYEIDKVEIDQATKYIFLHIDARDLPVLSIASQNNLSAGETVFSLSLGGGIYLGNISSIHDLNDYLSLSSDFYYDKISLVNKIGDEFESSFLFDISGRIVSFIDKNNNLIPSRVFNTAIDSLFENGFILRPSLGLKYADISYLVYNNQNKNDYPKKGALVLFQSKQKEMRIWEKAGIEVGDLIISVNGIDLDKNNNLTKIIMNYSPGDEIKIELLRETEKLEFNVKLGELE